MSNIDMVGIIEMSDEDMESLAGGYGYKGYKKDPCCKPDPCPPDPCPPDPCPPDPCRPGHLGGYLGYLGGMKIMF